MLVLVGLLMVTGVWQDMNTWLQTELVNGFEVASDEPVTQPTTPRDDDSRSRAWARSGWLRWTWRQLTSMRTALFLLLLLPIGAIPGSTFPQRSIDPARTTAWIADHPTAGPVLDRLGFFEVYASPWFAAIYLLLFVSLIGCVLPRTRIHWHQVRSAAAARAAPPRPAGRAPASRPSTASRRRCASGCARPCAPAVTACTRTTTRRSRPRRATCARPETWCSTSR